MKPKKTKSTLSKKKVSFAFYGPEAKDVFVVGDFNQWNETAHPMKKDSQGIWRKSIIVAPGSYEYKFLVNGKWENDQNNEVVRENTFGTRNNLFVVE